MVFKCCCFLQSVFVLFCVCLCLLCSSLACSHLVSCTFPCALFHTCPHSVSCSWACPCILSLVRSWILSCSLPLSHSLSLCFKNALYYHACPAGKSWSFGEGRQENGPALKQQTIHWHLLEDIVKPTLTVVLWCSVLMVFSLFFPVIWSPSMAYLFINEIKKFMKWT